MAITRRTFLKVAGAASGTAAALGSGHFLFGSLFARAAGPGGNAETTAADPKQDRVAFAGCFTCLGRCTLQIQYTENNIPRYVTGDIHGTVNEGGVCALSTASLLHYLSPARLRFPLLRRPGAERGSGSFVRIRWADMFDILLHGDQAAYLKRRGWKYGFLGMKAIRERFPEKLVYFTGRDQYNPTENTFFASAFGTPNQGAHGGFCSATVALGGTYTNGGTWWEYGGMDVENSRVVVIAGMTNDHFPTGTRRVMTKIRSRGARFIYIAPDRFPNLGPISDQWIALNPGTDGALVMATMHELWRLHRQDPQGRPYIDEDFLTWYSNSPWLVMTNPDGTVDPPAAGNVGLFARVKNSKGEWTPAVMGSDGKVYPFDEVPWQSGVTPSLTYAGKVTVPTGPDNPAPLTVPVTTAFNLLTARLADPRWAPEAVSRITGVPASTITEFARYLGDIAMRQAEWIPGAWTDYLGRKHKGFIGRPVTLYIMRGVAAHSNGFQTARDYMLLLSLLGAIDAPGGWRYKTPAPWPIPDGAYWPGYGFPPDPRARQASGATGGTVIQEFIRNDGTVSATAVHGRQPAVMQTTKPLIYTPDQLVVDENGLPVLIDRAFSWDAPLGLHRVWTAVNYDCGHEFPMRPEMLLWHITNPYWDNSYDLDKDLALVRKKSSDGRHTIPFVALVDTFYGNSVPFVDLAIPDLTFYERFGVHSLLDRPISTVDGPADSIQWPVLPALYGVHSWADTEIRLGEMLGLKAFLNPDGSPLYPKGYEDFIWKWQAAPGIGLLGGGRGNGTSILKGAPNPGQVDLYTSPRGIRAYQGYSRDKAFPGLATYPVRNGTYPAGVNPGQQSVGHAQFRYTLPVNIRYRRNVNREYLTWAHSVGLIPYAKPVPTQVYSEIIQKFRLAGYGKWGGANAYFLSIGRKDLAVKNAAPPTDARGQALRKILTQLFDPLPDWYAPLEWADDGSNPAEYPIITEHRHVNPWFYHHWENHNPWHRPLLPFSPLYLNPETAARYGLKTGDWAEFASRGGEKVRAMIEVTEATRPGVIWYWKARNVRPGTLAISPDSPEIRQGIMFNDIYSYQRPRSWGGDLPGQPGQGLLNLDPFTGQTAWGDLRLKFVGKSAVQESYYGDANNLLKAVADHSFQPAADRIPTLRFSAYQPLETLGLTWYTKGEPK
ncbi:Putative Sulfite/Sulfur reductase [Candidatus Hydrogenisulfobacillus filiaventi]|uniref:Sulfite/Sulfur reductase n=1 Tax=Candidatus Hydrogenisulfobacillus filiaventi TaxID=2707344 RepID=A0A6F8ZIN5_9FIRM|nr:molybdopterin-dependent oxidoreductase [Bacillota bacterium]CAB1129311.1 Putative Sulfite/Sulfur reductase [Candidatus Hydrogenisulfobacillus filiaventi]